MGTSPHAGRLKARPGCRRAIVKFQLRPTREPYIALAPDGSRRFVSGGMLKEMRRMAEEGYWPGVVRLDAQGRIVEP